MEIKKEPREIILTQGYVAIVDDEYYERINQHKWQVFKKAKENTVYARGIVKIYSRTKHVFMHRYIMGLISTDKNQIDHINHDGLDNRKVNLRVCSTSQNGMNRQPDKNVSSKYRGVSWVKRDKVWQVSIACNKKQYYLGVFKCEKEAAEAYNNRAKELYGEFACLNEIGG